MAQFLSDHRRDECERKIYQRIDVAGEVTITPKVECGPVSITCLEGRISAGELGGSGARATAGKRKCRVRFIQELLVEVPVEVQVAVDCDLVGIRCSHPGINPPTWTPEPDSSGCSSSSGSSGSSSESGCSADRSDSHDWSDQSGIVP